MKISKFLTGAILLAVLSQWSFAGLTVLPPHATVDGQTLGQLSGVWWQQVLQTPNETNPLTDPTGAFGASGAHGGVFFLYGTSSGTVNRTLSVPAGKTLFFPIANFEIDNNGFNRVMTDAELTNTVHQYASTTTSLNATIDGTKISNLFSHRELSPVYSFTSPKNQIFGYPAGSTSTGIADGYWLAVSGLSPGAHTLSFGGAFNGNVTFPAGVVDSTNVPYVYAVSGSVQTNYNVNVSASSAVPTPPAAWAALTALPIFALVSYRRRRAS
jgi:hypothetical protein